MEKISFSQDDFIRVLMNVTKFKNDPLEAKEYYKKMKNKTQEEYAQEKADDWSNLLKKEKEKRKEEYKKNFFKINKLPIKNFEDFKTKIYNVPEEGEKTKRVCIGYINRVDELKKGLYLHSDTRGSGKTFMAYILLNNLLNLNKSIYFTTSTELFFNLTKAISTNSGENYKIIEKCKSVSVLFIDDFGTEKVSEYVNNVLFNIFDFRLNNNKITIFTSNKTIENTSVDDKIKSRINMMCIPVKFPEQSIRNLKAKSENKNILELLMEE